MSLSIANIKQSTSTAASIGAASFLGLLLFLAASAPASEPPTNTVWLMPPANENGRAFRELFEHPDQWKETRALIDVLGYTDLNLKKQFTDEELEKWFAQMKGWGLKLGMEVGSLKPWGQTGEKTFKLEQPSWERVQRLGGEIYAIAMDEPLCCARKDLHQPDEYAVEETAKYIQLVRQHYPKALIGDIEPYPFLSLEELATWIGALQKSLARKQVRGLDFFRLDVDWVNFVARNKGSWPEVKKIEQFCRSRQIRFSLIYWAAGYPALQRQGLADDSTWYVSVMQQGYDYVLAGGAPDEYVIESWVGAPSRCVPETGDGTFTRSARDFVRRFVKRAK